ncbi:arabinan endo-1,5-alpha-L-arabinosidase [Xylanimonas sp. McL0601]|uniref:arabinan endo-1,5-alpha-L-arabinosidase n=1 Tax=Xylanimonas sp. McL0601 TaxID=3414739 RepID=UPI003CF47DCB
MTTTEPALVPDTASWGAEHAHDPTAVRDDDGKYWLYSTDAWSDGPVRGGVQIRRSADLVDWQFHGWALPGVPESARELTGARGLWAPEVVRVPGAGAPGTPEWRMYWSASTFGSRTSAIGLAVAPHPSGPWTHRGVVVTSTHDGVEAGVAAGRSPHGRGAPNAIDANVVVEHDADGTPRHWLVYGSFFGGLHAIELDPATGLALGQPDGEPHPGPGTLLARRPAAVEGALEGAFVLPRPVGGWALIASWDSLFDTYHLRAGVSEQVMGPYVDRTGRDLRDDAADDATGIPASAGTAVLTGHRLPDGPGLRGPGHASVLTEDLPDGTRQLLVHHVRDAEAPTRHRVQVRLLAWTHDGWPVVSLRPWAGTEHERLPRRDWPVDPRVLAGTWDLVDLSAAPHEVQPTHAGTLDVDDVVAHGEGRFSWTWPSGARAQAVVMPAWDAERELPTWTFAAVDDSGRTLAGSRREPADNL